MTGRALAGRVAPPLADLAAVVVFVAIGRSAHAAGVTIGGMVSTTWPFATGLAAGTLLARASHRDPRSAFGGGAVWIATVALGMALRVLSGQGTTVAFVGVALGFLGATMLGWRAALALVRRARSRGAGGRRAAPPRPGVARP